MMSVVTDDLNQRRERIERLLAEDIRKAACWSSGSRWAGEQ
jgi:hypothetical protein